LKFEFYNPTRLIFGAGVLEKLGEAVRPLGGRALLVMGRGSARRSGLYDRVAGILSASGVSVVPFEGVEPNPRLDTVLRGSEAARSEGCDVVVALGGGSVMDAAKVMAAGVFYPGDLWDMMYVGPRRPRLPERALPIVTVPTLAATGSEMNDGAVITYQDLKVKAFVEAECLFPRVAVVDPELTLTVPRNQTAYGVSDIIAHVTEAYFNGVDGTPIQDSFAEGVLRAVVQWGPVAVEEGGNLEARTQVQWASVVALNGWVQVGTRGAYPVHMMEHTLSGIHDVPHGAGLAVLNPAWMRFAAPHRPERFAQFARNVFGVREEDHLTAAMRGIEALEDLLKRMGCPLTLGELGISDPDPELYARATLEVAGDREGMLRGRPGMSRLDLVGIFRSVL
jgi:alcohol dehydrogenase YqhD (iron-dependent ADH family)